MKLSLFSSLLGLAVLGNFCDGLNITVGYLPSMFRYTEKGMLGGIVCGAISYAIKKINDDPLLLPQHRLNVIWQEAKHKEMDGAHALANMIRNDNAVAFFGPEASCSSPAIVAGAFNLPIFSHRCSEYTLSDHSKYPTFARTVPSDMSLAKALMSLLKTYSWSKISMVVEGTERSWMLSKAVNKQADMNNITVQHILTYTAPVSLLDDGDFSRIIMESYKNTRIYVFIGVNDINGLMAFLKTLQVMGLLDNGEYIVIYLDMDVYNKDEPQKYFTEGFTDSEKWKDSPLVDAVKSLLVITLNPPIAKNNENEDFQATVNWFLKQAPFKFTANRTKKIPVFGYYLYDAVFLYARALHQHLIENNSSAAAAAIIQDGQGIINRTRNIYYKSIAGHTVYINNHGDVVSKFYLLARKPLNTDYADISMLPVGEFTAVEDPALNLFDTIEWKNGKPPSIPCETDCNLTVEGSMDEKNSMMSYWQYKLKNKK